MVWSLLEVQPPLFLGWFTSFTIYYVLFIIIQKVSQHFFNGRMPIYMVDPAFSQGESKASPPPPPPSHSEKYKWNTCDKSLFHSDGCFVIARSSSLNKELLFPLIRHGGSIRSRIYCERKQFHVDFPKAEVHIAGFPCVSWSPIGKKQKDEGNDFVHWAAWVAWRREAQDSLLDSQMCECLSSCTQFGRRDGGWNLLLQPLTRHLTTWRHQMLLFEDCIVLTWVHVCCWKFTAFQWFNFQKITQVELLQLLGEYKVGISYKWSYNHYTWP